MLLRLCCLLPDNVLQYLLALWRQCHGTINHWLESIAWVALGARQMRSVTG
jgi:hypothetical protein